MPDALTLLATRRSVSARNMTFPGPSAKELDQILSIAVRVPDHGKLTPWRFIVYEGAARERAGAGLAAILDKRNADAERIEAARIGFTRAPVVVAVVSTAAAHPKIPIWEQELSAGAVCMALLAATHAAGYAGNWLTDWWAFDSEAKALLGVGPAEKVAGFIHIGTPKEPPVERPRPALTDVVSRWGA